ncbi:hypothetical protein GCM10009624_11950 [Gordonia sinesedis]
MDVAPTSVTAGAQWTDTCAQWTVPDAQWTVPDAQWTDSGAQSTDSDAQWTTCGRAGGEAMGGTDPVVGVDQPVVCVLCNMSRSVARILQEPQAAIDHGRVPMRPLGGREAAP